MGENCLLPSASVLIQAIERDAFLLVKDSLGWKVFLTLFMEMSQTLPAEGFFMWHKVSPQTTGLCVSSAETVHKLNSHQVRCWCFSCRGVAVLCCQKGLCFAVGKMSPLD